MKSVIEIKGGGGREVAMLEIRNRIAHFKDDESNPRSQWKRLVQDTCTDTFREFCLVFESTELANDRCSSTYCERGESCDGGCSDF